MYDGNGHYAIGDFFYTFVLGSDYQTIGYLIGINTLLQNNGIILNPGPMSVIKSQIDAIVDVDDDSCFDIVINTLCNYPNPFNSETTFSFSLNKDDFVDLTIYNIKGQKVHTLLSSRTKKGRHTFVWNGKNYDGKLLGSGIYFYRLTTSNRKSYIKKCFLIK